mmetsp:Transcript_9804/g.38173  ORF Transcript_9804/g.38173 Transcript_9804/m.38173 type:complete len:206 (-) Transcript_9804:273-890(-)
MQRRPRPGPCAGPGRLPRGPVRPGSVALCPLQGWRRRLCARWALCIRAEPRLPDPSHCGGHWTRRLGPSARPAHGVPDVERGAAGRRRASPVRFPRGGGCSRGRGLERVRCAVGRVGRRGLSSMGRVPEQRVRGRDAACRWRGCAGGRAVQPRRARWARGCGKQSRPPLPNAGRGHRRVGAGEARRRGGAACRPARQHAPVGWLV